MVESEYYIWGAGLYGGRLIEFMKEDLTFKAVIDNDPAKHGTTFCGLPIIGYDEAKKDLPDVKIVIAMNLPTKVRKFLMENGFKNNKDFFWIQDFITRFYWSKNKSIAVKTIDIAATTVCNLKCEACQVFIPMGKNQKHREPQNVIDDVDMMFNYVDSTMNLNFAVGENLLNKSLPEICAYIYKNYAGRYSFMTVQTNSSIIPDDDVLRRFSESNVVFGIAEYPETAKTRGKLLKKLNEFNLSWYINMQSNRDNWIDFGDPRIINETDVKKLSERYENCWKPGIATYDGRLYICEAQAWANLVAEAGSPETGDFFDLRQPKNENTLCDLNKIITRQTPQAGYISHCKRCNSVFTPLYQK